MKPFLLLLTLAVLAVTFSACDSGTTTDTATVTGTVVNTFNQPLQGGTVAFGTACSATTAAAGTFACDVPTGTYSVTVTVPGYTPATFSVTITEDGPITVPALAGPGAINATVVNGLTGDAIPDGAVTCARQLPDGTYGGIEFTGTTGPDGLLALTDLFTGEARCEIDDGTTTIAFEITITANTTGILAATPLPASGTFRIVLTWGEQPSDLDSHITGPDGASDRFHVYYSDETFGDTNLDVDDTSSYGPETVTLVPSTSGMYRYSVHNYSDQSGTGAAGIYASPTTVRLYDANGLLRTFVAPAPTAANGGTDANTWRVFELNVSGSTATIDGAAPAGMGYVLASSSGDTTTF